MIFEVTNYNNQRLISQIISQVIYQSPLENPKIDTIIVSQPRYMSSLQTLFTENKVDDWKAYMRWMLLRGASSQLSTTIETQWDACAHRTANKSLHNKHSSPLGSATFDIRVNDWWHQGDSRDA
jgi:predicted metalloendopeptidase